MILGVFIIGIVSAILFLQEREKLRKILQRSIFYQKMESLGKELLEGLKGYLKAPGENHRSDLRAVCGGIMDAENFIFSGTGAGSRNIGCITGTGNRDISYTGGDTAPFSGRDFYGGRVVSFICDHSRRQTDPGAQAGGKSCRTFSSLILLSVYLGLIIYGGFGFILGPLSALLLYGIFREWDLLLA